MPCELLNVNLPHISQSCKTRVNRCFYKYFKNNYFFSCLCKY